MFIAVDSFTGHCFAYLIVNKSEVLHTFQVYIQQIGKPHTIVRDHGTEFEGQFYNFCKTNSIHTVKSEAYTVWRNGKAERFNRSLKHYACSTLVHAGLPLKFWARAILTAAYVMNRLPSRSNNNGLPHVTLHELMYSHPPQIDHICVFGSVCYLVTPKPLQDGGTFMTAPPHVFVGCDKFSSEGYIVFNQSTKQFSSRRTVTFDEKWRTRHLDAGRITAYADAPLLTDYTQLLLPPSRLPPPSVAPSVHTDVQAMPLIDLTNNTISTPAPCQHATPTLTSLHPPT